MTDLTIGIIGYGETTYNNAADLLDDLLPENCKVFIFVTPEVEVIRNWLKEAEVDYEEVIREDLITSMLIPPTDKYALVVVGINGVEKELEECAKYHIPVLDLTRGLYQITQVLLPVAESKSESLEVESSTPAYPQEADRLRDRLRELEEEAKELRQQIAMNESGWEPVAAEGDSAAAAVIHATEVWNEIGHGETGLVSGVLDEERTRYYKSKRGKLRKAGKSKARPGETEIFLTEEEFESLAS